MCGFARYRLPAGRRGARRRMWGSTRSCCTRLVGRVRPFGSRVCGVAGRLASDLMRPACLLSVEVIRVAEQIHAVQREALDWSEISGGVLVCHRDLPGYVALQHSGTTFP